MMHNVISNIVQKKERREILKHHFLDKEIQIVETIKGHIPIVMVNFIYINLAGSWCQMFGQTLFRIFLRECFWVILTFKLVNFK